MADGATTRLQSVTTELEEAQRRIAALEQQLAQSTINQAVQPVDNQLADAGGALPPLPGDHEQQLTDSNQGSVNRPNGLFRLRPAPIDRFAGDRARTADFISAVDRRLKAVLQSDTFPGLEFAASHLTGGALAWWRYAEKRHPEVNSWDALRPLLQKAFCLPNEQQRNEDLLMRLEQTGSTDEYIGQFLDLSHRLEDLGDKFLQRRFKNGLCMDLKKRFATVADFDSLWELVSAVAESASRVPPELTGLGNLAPIASHARQQDALCDFCGKYGHVANECYSRERSERSGRGSGSNRSRGRSSRGASRASRGRMRPGRYNGGGRINAVEADNDAASDEDLRQGNENA